MKLLVVEDQPSLLDAVGIYLKRHGFVVDGALNLELARSYLRTSGYDGILLDMALPDGNGLDFLKELRKGGLKIPVIVMTARDQISDRIQGLEAGADDSVVKPFDLNEVLARFNAVLRRYQGAATPLVNVGVFEIDKSGQRLLRNGLEIVLTGKEWALVERLTRQQHAIVPKEDLEQALFSIDSDILSNSLEVHVSRIRKKIGKQHIQTVRGLGYRFIGDAVDEN